MKRILCFAACLVAAAIIFPSTAWAQDDADIPRDHPAVHLGVRTHSVLVIPGPTATSPDRLVRFSGPGHARIADRQIELKFDVLQAKSDKVVGRAVIRLDNPMQIAPRGQFRTGGVAHVSVGDATYRIPLKLTGSAKLVRPHPNEDAETDRNARPRRHVVIRGQFQGREETDGDARPAHFRGKFVGRQIRAAVTNDDAS